VPGCLESRSGYIAEPLAHASLISSPPVDDAVMTTALDVFRFMMRDEVAPELRRMGFKGSGQAFELPSETHWVLLGFQKATGSNSTAVRFTVNVTAASKVAWHEARPTHVVLPERPSANTYYGTFAWQKRIGSLFPDGEDRWWTVTSDRSARSVAADVLEAIRTYAIPAIQERLTESPSDA
jgi:hypothetical protein